MMAHPCPVGIIFLTSQRKPPAKTIWERMETAKATSNITHIFNVAVAKDEKGASKPTWRDIISATTANKLIRGKWSVGTGADAIDYWKDIAVPYLKHLRGAAAVSMLEQGADLSPAAFFIDHTRLEESEEVLGNAFEAVGHTGKTVGTFRSVIYNLRLRAKTIKFLLPSAGTTKIADETVAIVKKMFTAAGDDHAIMLQTSVATARRPAGWMNSTQSVTDAIAKLDADIKWAQNEQEAAIHGGRAAMGSYMQPQGSAYYGGQYDSYYADARQQQQKWTQQWQQGGQWQQGSQWQHMPTFYRAVTKEDADSWFTGATCSDCKKWMGPNMVADKEGFECPVVGTEDWSDFYCEPCVDKFHNFKVDDALGHAFIVRSIQDVSTSGYHAEDEQCEECGACLGHVGDAFVRYAYPGTSPCFACTECFGAWEAPGSDASDSEAADDEEAQASLGKRQREGETPQRDAATTANEKRNSANKALLRAWYPKHCSHHLLFHHVRGLTDRGCKYGAECRAGSHEAPPGLAAKAARSLDLATDY